eukprot:scaffold202456_cov28-Tisochrysis_lutea.AAC.5
MLLEARATPPYRRKLRHQHTEELPSDSQETSKMRQKSLEPPSQSVQPRPTHQLLRWPAVRWREAGALAPVARTHLLPYLGCRSASCRQRHVLRLHTDGERERRGFSRGALREATSPNDAAARMQHGMGAAETGAGEELGAAEPPRAARVPDRSSRGAGVHADDPPWRAMRVDAPQPHPWLRLPWLQVAPPRRTNAEKQRVPSADAVVAAAGAPAASASPPLRIGARRALADA